MITPMQAFPPRSDVPIRSMVSQSCTICAPRTETRKRGIYCSFPFPISRVLFVAYCCVSSPDCFVEQRRVWEGGLLFVRGNLANALQHVAGDGSRLFMHFVSTLRCRNSCAYRRNSADAFSKGELEYSGKCAIRMTSNV